MSLYYLVSLHFLSPCTTLKMTLELSALYEIKSTMEGTCVKSHTKTKTLFCTCENRQDCIRFKTEFVSVSWFEISLFSRILFEISNAIIQQAISAAAPKPHVENLWPASMVVSASLSVACLGLYLVAVVTFVCQQQDVSCVCVCLCVCVCVCGGGHWKDSSEADQVPLSRNASIIRKHTRIPQTYTRTNTRPQSDTEMSETWTCRRYTPSHRHPQTLKETHSCRKYADGVDTHIDRYSDSMQATAMHSYWQLRTIRLHTGKSMPAAMLWTIIVCVHTFINSQRPEA